MYFDNLKISFHNPTNHAQFVVRTMRTHFLLTIETQMWVKIPYGGT